MGKGNSKLKEGALERLIAETYCKIKLLYRAMRVIKFLFFAQLLRRRSNSGTKAF